MNTFAISLHLLAAACFLATAWAAVYVKPADTRTWGRRSILRHTLERRSILLALWLSAVWVLLTTESVASLGTTMVARILHLQASIGTFTSSLLLAGWSVIVVYATVCCVLGLAVLKHPAQTSGGAP